MCNVKPLGVREDQLDQLEEMAIYFFKDDETEVYLDPDFPDNVVFTSQRGDNYNSVGWYQVCFDMILPKVIDDRDELRIAFAADILVSGNHPVDMLYSPYLAFKHEQFHKNQEENV